jgi:thymidylate synthase (FAD)
MQLPMTMQESQKQVKISDFEECKTLRAGSPELEEILYKPIKVLDHGFVRVIDYMGNDSSIVQAARVSYGAGTKKTSQDRGLIFYLLRHRHTTPFEMCEIKLHVKLPMFVARQWIRHRTANVNECSARYSILPKEFYLPAKEYLAEQSTNNKQGRDNALSEQEADRILNILKEDSTKCYQHYEEMLNEDLDGNILDESRPKLAREIARLNLTMNYYTEWYWKTDLHNLLNFLKLRSGQGAQYEIRAYADVMLDIVKKWVPIAHEAFEEYSIHGAYISKKGLEILKQRLKGEDISQEESGMSKREWSELMQNFE